MSRCPRSLSHPFDQGLSAILITYVATGLAFMLLPGTLIGVVSLLTIAAKQTPGSADAAWIQAHGHAQIFGWLGTFILGIALLHDSAAAPQSLLAAGRLDRVRALDGGRDGTSRGGNVGVALARDDGVRSGLRGRSGGDLRSVGVPGRSARPRRHLVGFRAAHFHRRDRLQLAWRVLPFSAITEMVAVGLFAGNMLMSLTTGTPFDTYLESQRNAEA